MLPPIGRDAKDSRETVSDGFEAEQWTVASILVECNQRHGVARNKQVRPSHPDSFRIIVFVTSGCR